MTTWIVTHTDRFKVAIVGAAATNLLSFVNTTDMRDLMPDYLGMHPWEGPETYNSRSPITYVANAKIPTLIIHGEADPRVPVAQGLELFYALRQRSVPTRMLVLPRQPHNPVEPKMSLAVNRAGLDWIERYLPPDR